MFPNLKLVKIILGVYNPEKIDMFFEALRRETVGRDWYCKTCHVPLKKTRRVSFCPRDL